MLGRTHYDLNVRVHSPQRLDDGVIRSDNLLRRLAHVRVVRAQHEVHDVGLGLLGPPGDVLVRDVDGLPAGMAFVAGVEVAAGRGAALGVIGHGADEVNLGGEALGGEHVPDEGTPAGDLGDGVAKGDWDVSVQARDDRLYPGGGRGAPSYGI